METKEQKKKKKISKPRKIMGIALILVGLAIIASVFIVPAVNRRNNDKAIEEIKKGMYAEVSEGAVLAQTVTPESVRESLTVATGEAVTEEPSVNDEKMEKILADNSRIGIIEIEKIDVLYAIVEGTEDAQINRAVGHLTESVGIGEKGNCVVAGHRGGYYGTFFERLPELETGDVVKLTDLNGKEYYYSVYDKKMIDPTDWSVTKNLDDKHTLTMITCEDDTRKRIVVSAILFEQ